MGVQGNPSPKKMNMKRALETIDMFGQKPELSIGDEEQCKSACGGVLTLMLGLLYFTLFTYSIYQFASKTNPESNFNAVYVPNPKGFIVSRDNLLFAFGLQAADFTHFIDESIYTVEVQYNTITKTMNSQGMVDDVFESTILPLVRCSEVGLDAEYFYNLELSNLLCLKEYTNPTGVLNITGRFESPKFGWLKVIFNRCDPLTSKVPCQSDAVINNKLVGSFFAIYYLNYATETADYMTPIKKYPSSYFFSTSPLQQKNVQMRIANNELNTHRSFFGYSSPQVTEYETVDKFTPDVVAPPLSGYPPSFLEFAVRMEPIKQVVNRSYRTIYQLIAELGGIGQIISFLILILNSKMTKLLLYVKITTILKSSETISSSIVVIKKNESSQFSPNIISKRPIDKNLQITPLTPSSPVPPRTLNKIHAKARPSNEAHSPQIKESDPLNKRSRNSKSILNCNRINSPEAIINSNKTANLIINVNEQRSQSKLTYNEEAQPGDEVGLRGGINSNNNDLSIPVHGSSTHNLRSIDREVNSGDPATNNSPDLSSLESLSTASIFFYSLFPFFYRNSRTANMITAATALVSPKLDICKLINPTDGGKRSKDGTEVLDFN